VIVLHAIAPSFPVNIGHITGSKQPLSLKVALPYSAGRLQVISLGFTSKRAWRPQLYKSTLRCALPTHTHPQLYKSTLRCALPTHTHPQLYKSTLRCALPTHKHPTAVKNYTAGNVRITYDVAHIAVQLQPNDRVQKMLILVSVI
jgi:hypothetical protein